MRKPHIHLTCEDLQAYNVKVNYFNAKVITESISFFQATLQVVRRETSPLPDSSAIT